MKGFITYRNVAVNAICNVRGGMNANMVDDLESSKDPRRARAARFRTAWQAKWGTAVEAAAALGMNVNTVRSYSGAHRTITADAAGRLAPALGVEPQWLLFGTGREKIERGPENSINLSVFLTSDVDNFRQIRNGAVPPRSKVMHMLSSPTSLPDRLYAVEVPDAAMSRDGWPTCPQGAKAILRPLLPGEEPERGAIVHTVIGDAQDSVIREWRRQRAAGGDVVTVLTAFNAAYEEIVLDPVRDFAVGIFVGILFLPA